MIKEMLFWDIVMESWSNTPGTRPEVVYKIMELKLLKLKLLKLNFFFELKIVKINKLN